MMTIQNLPIKKIAVFRALQLGDMLCAIPGLRALRQLCPHAEITLLGLPWAESVLKRFPRYFDRFMHFPGFPGLPEQPFQAQAFHKFLGEVIAQRFDLVLQMQGNGSIVNPMVVLFNATYTAGYYLSYDYCPNKDFFIEYPEGIHETERHLRLMQHLGSTDNDTSLEFPLFEEDENELKRLSLPVSPGRYVCVHPGSRGVWRQWPTAYFAALADRCAEEGLTIVLTGTASELPLVHEVAAQMQHQPVIAAGKTSLGAVGVLLRDAYALISNCTGVSHIAAALRTPSIVISMDGEPERWAPLNKELHFTINWKEEPYFNKVLDACENLLERKRSSNEFRDQRTVALKHLPDRL